MATVSELLDIARRQIGTRESPPNSNNVRYNTWYYGREVSGAAYPWCMVFVQWVFDQAGVKLPVRTASCGALMRSAQSAGCWVTGNYQPGDVVIYDFPGGAKTDHCGIVESVDGTYISAIEGNTSSTSDADGGAVERRARKFSQIGIRSDGSAAYSSRDGVTNDGMWLIWNTFFIRSAIGASVRSIYLAASRPRIMREDGSVSAISSLR